MIPYHDDNPTYSIPFINYTLILVNCVVFLFELLSGFSSEVFEKFGMIPAIFWHAPVANAYRIITSMFVHGGWMHIIGNMLFLWIFGDNVEDVLGHFRYLMFYLVAGICGTILESLVTFHSDVPLVGASAAISGVIAGYFMFFPKVRIRALFLFFIKVSFPAGIYIIIWIVTQFLSGLQTLVYGGQVGGVAYLAHVGGIIFGFLYCKSKGMQLFRKWAQKIHGSGSYRTN
jgi:membrane associated rhomboid family serine protease